MIWDTWTDRWQLTLEACRRVNSDYAYELIIGEPAQEAVVAKVEKELQFTLPLSFRQVLTRFASQVNFSWDLPYGIDLPEALKEISGGECSWSLDKLVQAEQSRIAWVNTCFPDPSDPYGRIWRNKCVFHRVANGDRLALDLAVSPSPVIYLSHDGGAGNGYQLGTDFTDFIDRWTRLGCVGSSYYEMKPFLASPTSLLDPDCENARLWRSVFGLDFS